jgi:hypothetical protein
MLALSNSKHKSYWIRNLPLAQVRTAKRPLAAYTLFCSSSNRKYFLYPTFTGRAVVAVVILANVANKIALVSSSSYGRIGEDTRLDAYCCHPVVTVPL